jgi:hypothetical protein
VILRRRRGREGRRRGRGAARLGRVGPEHVLEAARVLRAALAPHLHRDWSVRAGDLTWSCRETLLHAADCWYAVELSSQRRTWLPPLLAWRAELTPEEGLAAHDAAAALLAAVMRGMPPEARGYHGQPTDAEGFAAMHCDEVLVHGCDIAPGLGVAFSPPPALARRVRDRLFPWTPAGDPWTTLLWCNGRVALPDYERLTDWSWHPAPLSAWDGTRRRRER